MSKLRNFWQSVVGRAAPASVPAENATAAAEGAVCKDPAPAIVAADAELALKAQARSEATRKRFVAMAGALPPDVRSVVDQLLAKAAGAPPRVRIQVLDKVDAALEKHETLGGSSAAGAAPDGAYSGLSGGEPNSTQQPIATQSVDAPQYVLQNPYEQITIPKLRKLAVTDPGAAEELRLRFRNMLYPQLERYARNGDPMAQMVIEQRLNERLTSLTEGHGRFSNPKIGEELTADLGKARRNSGILRRSPIARGTEFEVDPSVTRTEGGTMGVFRSDVEGLDGPNPPGKSKKAGGEPNPNSEFTPQTDPEKLPHTHDHAEQRIADALDAKLSNIPPEKLRGKTVWMLIEQEPCSPCAEGLDDPAKKAGVLRKLSEKYKGLTFEIRNTNSSELLVIKNGTLVNRGAGSTGNAAPMPNEPPQVATPGTELAVAGEPSGKIAQGTAGPLGEGHVGQGRVKAPSAGPGVAREIAAEMAREAATDLKLLRAARVLTAATEILQGITALQMLDEFTGMAMKGLAGEGFILHKEIQQSADLSQQASDLQRSYPSFSQSLTATQGKLFQASTDPAAAAQALVAVTDVENVLRPLHGNIEGQLQRIDRGVAEANAKQKAARVILEDPKASAAIAMASFGTGELAKLLAASEDLIRISGSLSQAARALRATDVLMQGDLEFVEGWRMSLQRSASTSAP